MGVKYLSFAVRIILLQQMCCSCFASAGFVESPSSETIEIENGVERFAVFRCQHQNIDAVISWQINETSSRRYRDVVDGFIRDDNDTRVDTLTIPAIPDYNGTEVVCIATFDGAPLREVSPPAVLITIVALVTQPSTSPPPTDSTDKEPGFIMTPLPVNRTVEQQVAVFHCQHSSSDDITWRVNGASFSTSPNISFVKDPRSGGGFRSSLSIATLPDFNETSVQCVGIFYEGTPFQFTPPVTLLIQDIPGNIRNFDLTRNYSSGILTTFWDPLSSIDITDTHPDIIYHVEIYKTTCGRHELVTDENVTESFIDNLLSPLELMETYEAFVTPRNNVPEYVDGPKRERNEKFMALKGVTLFELSRSPPVINITDVEPVPHYYTMMLESLDGIAGNMQVNISVQRDGETITMRTGESLPPKCLWKALILPYGCEVDSQVTELSTHVIQNVVVTSNPNSRPAVIRVMGDFVDGSGATGVLLIVWSLTSDSDIRYMNIAKQPGRNRIITDVTDLTVAEYGVSTFALESGLPFSRVATVPTNVNVAVADTNDREGIPQQSAPIEFKLDTTSSGVCITCTFLDDSNTECVAVVHQRISQLNSSGLMDIRSQKFTRLDDTAKGCIEDVDLEQHQVGIINGRRVLPIRHPDVREKGSPLAGAIVGTVLALMLSLIVIVTVAVVVWRKRLKTTADLSRYMYSESGISAIVNNASGSAGYSHYDELVEQREEETERPATEERPLLNDPLHPRVVEDGEPTPPLPPRMIEDVGSTSNVMPRLETAITPSRSPVAERSSHSSPGAFIEHQESIGSAPGRITSDNSSTDPMYSQPVLPKTSNMVSPPAVTEKLIYDDIQGFQNQKGQIYALPQLKSTSKRVVDDLHQVEYCEIQAQSQGEVTCSGPVSEQPCDAGPGTLCNTCTPPPRDCLLSADLLFLRLLPYASKWQSLGEALSLDEDRLDEIFTNNETDETCLREMVELYMMRSDLDHSWEKIESALKSSPIASGVQETDSSSISQTINGSTKFPSGVHTMTRDWNPSHITDQRMHAKTHHSEVVHIPGIAVALDRRWHSLGVLSMEAAEEANHIHCGVDYEFKSEPNLPYSQGSERFDEHPQCTLTYNKENTLAATGDEEVDRRTCLENFSSPKTHAYQCCSIELFVANKEHDEELFGARLPPQESHEEASDYNAALIKQLGIGRENPSNRDKYEEPPEHNIDVNAGSVLAPLLTLRPWNCISSTLDALSVSCTSLQKVPTQKISYHSCRAPLMSCTVTYTSTVGERTALWRTLEWIGEWLEKICLCYRVSSSEVNCRFSRVLQYLGVCNFVPLEYPT